MTDRTGTLSRWGGRSAAVLCAMLGLVGCQLPEYAPPALPAFMREDVSVGGPGPGCAGTTVARLGPPEECRPSVPPPVGSNAPLPTRVTLPEAVHEAVFANLRLQSGQEKIRQAQGDFTTSSLIPNPQFLFDTLLNPLPGTRFTPTKQGGPPQDDVAVTFPIDWLLFGKRVAAMEAARLGVDVAAADLADLVRQRVADTVSAYYDILEAKEQLGLAMEDLTDLRRLEDVTKRQVAAGGAGTIELDRIRLDVIDRQRELRRREVALANARSKLRPLLGRATLDPAFDAVGSLDIAVAAPVLHLEYALELAEKNRPDLISRARQIAKTGADVESEKRKAYPQVSVQPVFTYQFQREAIGFPDARSYGVALTASLPITDRNQGNIAKAEANQREAVANYRADLADLRAEVEQAVEGYRVALATATSDDVASLEAARRLRDRTEAAFKAGGRRLLEVLDAQRAYRDRVRATITNRADYWRSLNRLNAAVGIRAVE